MKVNFGTVSQEVLSEDDKKNLFNPSFNEDITAELVQMSTAYCRNNKEKESGNVIFCTCCDSDINRANIRVDCGFLLIFYL
jgi:hypothetical protein